MYTTYSENGILNNYSNEPTMYYAHYPSFYERQNYVKLGIMAALFVSTLVATAFVIS